MKTKIFKLYKEDSLQEFLAFKKQNPKEDFVYVLQQPPANINILSASDFGYLVLCMPQFEQIIFSPGPDRGRSRPSRCRSRSRASRSHW